MLEMRTARMYDKLRSTWRGNVMKEEGQGVKKKERGNDKRRKCWQR